MPESTLPSRAELGALARLAELAPEGGLQVMDARRPVELNPLVALVVCQLADQAVAEAAQRFLLRFYPSDHPVTLTGVDPAGEPVQTTLGELNLAVVGERAGGAWLAPLNPEQAGASPFGLRAIVHRLRAPGGCPWDAKQSSQTLSKYVLEEAYEVVDAIEDGSSVELCDELGDLLLQVYLQAELAGETSKFDLTDVVQAISKKLIRRHPHVFATTKVSGADEVELNWEQLKRAEKGAPPESAIEGVPRSLPALARAQEIQRKLKRAGFDWPDRAGAIDKLTEEQAELLEAGGDPEAFAHELGDVLFIVARLAGDAGTDAEAALRGAIIRVEGRFRHVERVAKSRGVAVADLPLDELLALWGEAKTIEAADQLTASIKQS